MDSWIPPSTLGLTVTGTASMNGSIDLPAIPKPTPKPSFWVEHRRLLVVVCVVAAISALAARYLWR